MKKYRIIILIIIIALSLFVCNYKKPYPLSDTEIAQSEDTAQFHFIDVGQGDCILIQNGKTNIMIDAGTYESGSVICKYLEDLGIEYLDYFIGTHPHEDHLGGASSVLRSVDVGTVFLGGETSTAYYFEKLVDVLIERDIEPVIPDMNCIYEIGALRLKFLSPTKDFKDTNHNSLIAMVQFKDVKAIFTGDAEAPSETNMIEEGLNLSADILKVGHHGSRYGSTAKFLAKVKPSVSVISCGENNSYGHPHKEALERLSAIGTTVLRTDKLGTVLLRTDGKNIYNATGEVIEKNNTDISNYNTEEVYIGNKKSKIFHISGCPNLPSEKNSVNLISRESAIDEGYKACGNCNP